MVEEGRLRSERKRLTSTCMKELLLEDERLIKQGRSKCIRSGGGSSSVAISLWDNTTRERTFRKKTI